MEWQLFSETCLRSVLGRISFRKPKSARALWSLLFSCSVPVKKLGITNRPTIGKRDSSMDNDVSGSNNIVCNHWRPGDIINGEIDCSACIILNRNISAPASVVQNIWQNAGIRCTVDGGTNRWRDFLSAHCQGKLMKVPDYITGDFDSITEETSKFFCDPTINRVHTPDQNDTDFTKSIGVLRPLLEHPDPKSLKNIVVFHDTSGRLDQIMANINTVFKVQSKTLHVYLVSGNSMTWLLQPGKHFITIPCDMVEQKRWCALIPIGEGASCVNTRGLRWNLVNAAMKFGELVSTSNTYASECVHIETDGSLLWSMGLFSFDDD